MINHKEKYKVTVEDILTFLNYKKEINITILLQMKKKYLQL